MPVVKVNLALNNVTRAAVQESGNAYEAVLREIYSMLRRLTS